jgi:hypothetical protein
MKKELSTSEFLAHVNKIRKHALKNDWLGKKDSCDDWWRVW